MFKIHVEKEIAVMHQLKWHDGKCRNEHGHNLLIEVDVETENIIKEDKCSSDGMVVDFGFIKGLIESFDHSNLNKSLGKEVPEALNQPTAERFAKFIADTIESHMFGSPKITVKVHEAKGQWAEYSNV